MLLDYLKKAFNFTERHLQSRDLKITKKNKDVREKIVILCVKRNANHNWPQNKRKLYRLLPLLRSCGCGFCSGDFELVTLHFFDRVKVRFEIFNNSKAL